jgi:carboxyl-terminal processing protease
MLTRIHRPLSLLAITFGATLVAFSEVPLETTFQMKAEIKDMRMAMERLHFSGKVLVQEDFEQLIPNYMKRLDFNHLYFLKSDLLLWEQRFGRTLKNNYLDRNELYPAFYMFNTFENRVNARLEWTRQFLEGEINLFESEQFPIDFEDRVWPQTQADADILWRQRLKNELLVEIVPKIREKLKEHYGEEPVPDLDTELLLSIIGVDFKAEVFKDATERILTRYERWAKRISEMKPAEVQEDFLTELAKLYDPHSNFMSPDTSEDFGISISNELIGIGAVLSDDNGYCKIMELIDGGPAAKSGELKVGDTIVGVAQGKGEFEDVVGKRLRDIVRLIRGKEDSLVRLQIRSETTIELKEVPITRKRIQLEEKLASAELHQVPSPSGPVPIGVIRLPNFYGPSHGNTQSTRASDDIDLLITKLKEQGVQGLVLDLRNNGGGLLDEAINVTGLFITTGPVVKVKNRAGDIDISRDYDPRVSWEGPLAVMTSRYSASASEIVAGALQYYRRALIIGDESTHGKGTVQSTFTLPISVYDMMGRDNRFVRPNLLERVGRLIPSNTSSSGMPSMAKITIAKYYLPDGTSTQLRGVVSDINLPSIAEMLPIRESDLDNPLAWDQIEGVPLDPQLLVSNAYPYLQPNLVSLLHERSEERRDALEEFQYLLDSIQSFSDRYNRESVPLNLVERINMLNQDDRRNEALDAWRDTLNAFTYEHLKISLKEPEPEAELSIEDASAAPEASTTVATDASDNDADAMDAEGEADGSDDRFDIHLRESIRIVSDWILLENELESGTDEQQIAILPTGESLALHGPLKTLTH